MACARDIATRGETPSQSLTSCSQLKLQNEAWDASNSQLMASCFFTPSEDSKGNSATLSHELLKFSSADFVQSSKFLNLVAEKQNWPLFIKALSTLPSEIGVFLKSQAGQAFLSSPDAPLVLREYAWFFPLLQKGTIQKALTFFTPSDLPLLAKAWKEILDLNHDDRRVWLSSAYSLVKSFEQDPVIFSTLRALASNSSCQANYFVEAPLELLFQKVQKHSAHPHKLSSLLEQSYFFFSKLCPTHDLSNPALFKKLLLFIENNSLQFQHLFAHSQSISGFATQTLLRMIERNTHSVSFLFEIAAAAEKEGRVFNNFNSPSGIKLLGELLMLNLDLSFFENLNPLQLNSLAWLFEKAHRSADVFSEWVNIYRKLSPASATELALFFERGAHQRWADLGHRLWPENSSSTVVPTVLEAAPAPVFLEFPTPAQRVSCLDDDHSQYILLCALNKVRINAKELQSFSELPWISYMADWLGSGDFEKVKRLSEKLHSQSQLKQLFKTYKDLPYRKNFPFETLAQIWPRIQTFQKAVPVILCTAPNNCEEHWFNSFEIGWEILKQYHFPEQNRWIQKKIFQTLFYRLSQIKTRSDVQEFFRESSSLVETFKSILVWVPGATNLDMRKDNLNNLLEALPRSAKTADFLNFLMLPRAFDTSYISEFLAQDLVVKNLDELFKIKHMPSELNEEIGLILSQSTHKALVMSATRPQNAPPLYAWLSSDFVADLFDILFTVKLESELSP